VSERLVAVGRVGRPHGVDGSFYVERVADGLAEGTRVVVAGDERVVARRAGTDARPLVRLAGVEDRDAAAALRSEELLVLREEVPLADDEWLIDDLVGCEVPGLGTVRAVIPNPSCDVLDVGEGDGPATLVPLVRDAVTSVDVRARVIEVDRGFLGLEP